MKEAVKGLDCRKKRRGMAMFLALVLLACSIYSGRDYNVQAQNEEASVRVEGRTIIFHFTDPCVVTELDSSVDLTVKPSEELLNRLFTIKGINQIDSGVVSTAAVRLEVEWSQMDVPATADAIDTTTVEEIRLTLGEDWLNPDSFEFQEGGICHTELLLNNDAYQKGTKSGETLSGQYGVKMVLSKSLEGNVYTNTRIESAFYQMDEQLYTISVVPSEFGTVSGGSRILAKTGELCEITFTPERYYEISRIDENGTDILKQDQINADGSYTITYNYDTLSKQGSTTDSYVIKAEYKRMNNQLKGDISINADQGRIFLGVDYSCTVLAEMNQPDAALEWSCVSGESMYQGAEIISSGAAVSGEAVAEAIVRLNEDAKDGDRFRVKVRTTDSDTVTKESVELIVSIPEVKEGDYQYVDMGGNSLSPIAGWYDQVVKIVPDSNGGYQKIEVKNQQGFQDAYTCSKSISKEEDIWIRLVSLDGDHIKGKSGWMQVELNIDTEPPVIYEAVTPLAKGEWSRQEVPVTVKAEDTDSGSGIQALQYAFDRTFTNVKEASQIQENTYTFIAETKHGSKPVYYIRAVDKAGHVSEVTTVSINIDYEKPEIVSIDNPSANGNWLNINHEVRVEVKDTGGSKAAGIRYKTAKGTDKEVTASVVSGDSLVYSFYVGNHSDTSVYEIYAYDHAGNHSDTKSTKVHVDCNIPRITDIEFTTTEFPQEQDKVWKPLHGTLFGHFYNDTVGIKVKIEKAGNLSGIRDVCLEYQQGKDIVMITAESVRLTESAADSNLELYQARFRIDPVDVPAEYNNIRAWVTDGAGNRHQISYAELEGAADLDDGHLLNNLLIEKTPPEITFDLAQIKGDGIYRDSADGKLWSSKPLSFQALIHDEGSGIYQYTYYMNGQTVCTETYQEKVESMTADVSTDHVNNISGTLITAINDFEYHISVNAVDNSKNSSVSSCSVYIDQVKPQVVSVQASADGWTDTSSVIISGKVQDAGSGMKQVIYGNSDRKFEHLSDIELQELLQSKAIYSAEFDYKTNQYKITAEGEQDQTYYIWAIDKVGNVSTAVKQTVKIDLTAPSIERLKMNAYKHLKFGSFSNQPVMLEIDVSDGDISSQIQSVTVLDGNRQITEAVKEIEKNKKYTCLINPVKKYENLRIRVMDKVGHRKELPVSQCISDISIQSNRLLLEQSKPLITLDLSGDAINIEGNTWFSDDIEFLLDIQDNKSNLESGINSIIVKLNEKITYEKSYEACSEAVSKESISISSAQVERPDNGKYVLQVQVEDNAGNTAKEERVIYIDRDKPEIKRIRILDHNNTNIELDRSKHYLPFGNFYNGNVYVEISYLDAAPSSGIEQGQVKLYTETQTLTPDWIEEEADSSGRIVKKAYFEMKLLTNEKKLQVEVKDNTGHTTGKQPIHAYNEDIHHDGLMLEKEEPKIKISMSEPDYIQTEKHEEKNWYQSDISINMEVKDPDSGLRSIRVDMNGVTLINRNENEEQSKKQLGQQIEAVHEVQLDIHTNQVKAQDDGSYVLQVQVEDNAGNTAKEERVIYIDRDKPEIKRIRIVDRNHTDIELDKVNHYLPFGNFYNGNVYVELSYTDRIPSSGVAPEQIMLYTEAAALNPVRIEEETDGSGSIIKKAYFEMKLPINEEKLQVEVKDNTGHTTEKQSIRNCNEDIRNDGLMLENQKPDIEITVPTPDYISNRDGREELWYKSNIIYTARVTDSDSGIRSVNANINGTDVINQMENARQLKENIYTASTGIQGVARNIDGSYLFHVSAVDNADNVTQISKQIYTDTGQPRITAYRFDTAGSIEGQGVPTVTDQYGYYFQEPARLLVAAEDLAPSSGLWKIEYRLVNVNGETSNGIGECINDQIAINLPADFKGKIYTTAIDHVGNIGSEQSLEGVVQESPQLHSSASKVQLTKPETDKKDTQGLDLYHTSIPVTLHVEDTFSGIRTIDWRVEAAGDPENNQSGHLDIDSQGELLGDTEWNILNSDKNIRTALEKTIMVRNNSNTVVVTLEFTDRAGNHSSDSIVFSIDTTAPQIQVSYSNNEDDSEHEGYFKEARTAEVRITERNFHAEDVIVTITNSENILPSYGEWTQSRGTGNEDDTIYTMRIEYDADGDYTFDIQYTDLAGNQAAGADYGNSVTPTEFTIDRTLPVISLSYNDDAGTSVVDHYYYQKARVAVITIEEHNFDESRAIVTITSKDNNGTDLGNAPTVGGWSTSGDTRTASITFDSEDANYSIAVQYTDMAGNQAADIEEQTFCIDQNDPAIEITGVEDRHAYNEDMIRPIITFTDVNLDAEQTQIILTGASQGDIVELSGEDSRSADSRRFELENLREDDIYTLTAHATDKAGRTNSVTCRFSVNRHGSTYELSEETVSINHTYTNVPVDIVVREINVDPLQQDSVIVTLSKDNIPGDLQEGRDYRMEKAGQDGEWSVYTYTIYKENYSEDGNYGIRLYSVDGAENISQNNLEDENKKAEINFHVDKTSPNLSILNLKDGETYPFDSQNASISVGDNTFVKEIQILLNGEVAASYDKNEIKEKADKNENYQIAIANSNQSQSIQVIAVDAAGNQSKAEVTDFYVTTNLWIRFINNKLALYGTITGGLLFAAAIVAIVFLKRKQSYGRQSENS